MWRPGHGPGIPVSHLAPIRGAGRGAGGGVIYWLIIRKIWLRPKQLIYWWLLWGETFVTASLKSETRQTWHDMTMTHDPNMPHLDAGIMQCDCDTQAELYSVHLYCTVYRYTLYSTDVHCTPVLYSVHLYSTAYNATWLWHTNSAQTVLWSQPCLWFSVWLVSESVI